MRKPAKIFMVYVFQQKLSLIFLQCNTSPLEEAIIEMEQPSLIQTPPNPKSRKPSSR